MESLHKLDINQRIRFLTKDVVVYGVALALSKLTTLITFPLLARHFSVEEYGLINYYNIIVSFLAIFVVFGLDSGVARFFFDCKTIDEKKQLISQALFFQIGIIFLAFIIIWFLLDFFPEIISDDKKNIEYFKIALLQIPFLVLLNFSQNILKWTFKKYKFLTISIGFIFINLTLLFVVLMYSKADVGDVFIINIVSACIASFIGIYFIREWFVLPKTFKRVLAMKSFVLPLGVICTARAFFPYFERSMIISIIDTYYLGLYTAGFAVANLTNLVVQSFNTAWNPISLSIYKDPDAYRTYNVVLKGFTFIICTGVFLLSAIGEFFMLIFAGEKYIEASVLIFPISMSIAIQAIGWIIEIGIGLSKKTYLHLYSFMVYFIIVSGLIISLVGSLHIYGIAIAILIAQIIKSLVSYYFAQKAYPIQWKCNRVFIFIILNVFLGLFCDFIKYYSLINMNLYIPSVFLIFGIGWFFLFSNNEKNIVLQYIRTLYLTLLRNKG